MSDPTIDVREEDELTRWIEALHRAHATQLREAVLARFHDNDLASDAVQEVFLRLWRSRRRYGGKSLSRSFLLRSAHNAGVDLLRSRQSIERMRAVLTQLSPRSVPAIDRAIETREFETNLRRLVKKLPRRCGAAFALWYFDGRTQLEIAVEMHIGVKRVERHIARAKQRLIENLNAAFWRSSNKGGLRHLRPF